MSRREFSIIIVPHSGGRTIERRFSVLGFRILLAVAVSLVLGTAILAVLAARANLVGIDYRALKTRNAALEQQLSKLDYLKVELDRIGQEGDRVRGMLGFDQQPPPLDLQQLYAAMGSESAAQFLSQEEDTEPSAALPRSGRPAVPSIPPLDSFDVSRGLSPGHSGVDLVAETGARVRATADGRVVFASWDTVYGNAVRVQHREGFVTFYGHLLRITRLPGDSVRQGQTLGLLGSTGRSTSPHLHYEVRRNGREQDPEQYFR